MAITFPSNPSDGDTFTWGGVRYTFDSTPGAWVGSGGSDPVILYGTTFPNNGLEGELFYYEGATSGDPARLYVYNGGVWVDAAPAATSGPAIPSGNTLVASLGSNQSVSTTAGKWYSFYSDQTSQGGAAVTLSINNGYFMSGTSPTSVLIGTSVSAGGLAYAYSNGSISTNSHSGLTTVIRRLD